ncbi:glutathione peroxidase [Methylomonas rosea]|uniref:Glutathione peroxidase n=1 Tax=Methylomonas rosea TaxID=2952227 RepID=A0ABT1TVE9_9GAMM|nr:glutathione peroxidase [Methylomonas sp. WSC-7]MCQ8118744.1 glutathione peroxidase [Methylomonas sp. WSC-7]
MNDIYQFSATKINGETVALADYRGKVLLIVNTASQCGFTPQYRGLEALYQTYKSRGLVVLGFPCNQFGQQEPGDSQEIASFCELNYGVSFPMFEKIDVNGNNAHPLFEYLKTAAPGILGFNAIKWNFSKFLVGRDGKVFKRYAPIDTPAGISKDIERLLGLSDAPVKA